MLAISQPSLTADLLPNYLRLAERLLNGDCSELGFLRDWQRIGALRERVVHFAGGAAPLGERSLDAPRALGDVQRLEENRRIVDHDFGLKKSAALDQLKPRDTLPLIPLRLPATVHNHLFS